MKAHIKIEFDLSSTDYHAMDPSYDSVDDLVRAMISRKADFPDSAFGGIKIELSGCPNDTDGDDRCGVEGCPHCRPTTEQLVLEAAKVVRSSGITSEDLQRPHPPVPVCHACGRRFEGEE
jgi:hypothetical protein